MTDKVLISNNYKQLTEHKKKKPQLKQCEELDPKPVHPKGNQP